MNDYIRLDAVDKRPYVVLVSCGIAIAAAIAGVICFFCGIPIVTVIGAIICIVYEIIAKTCGAGSRFSTMIIAVIIGLIVALIIGGNVFYICALALCIWSALFNGITLPIALSSMHKEKKRLEAILGEKLW